MYNRRGTQAHSIYWEIIEMLIGIIGAMARETDAVIARISSPETHTICGIRYCKGTLEGVPVVAAQCGIGKVFAALCAALMIEHWHPDLILNIGVAGALTDGLDIADIVIADSAVEHDMDTTPIGDPPGLISGPNVVHMPVNAAAAAGIARAAKSLGCHTVTAAIATGDQFIEHLEDKQRIARDFCAAACDMEGGAIAQVAMTAGVPYAAYRAISDTLRGNGQEYALNADRAAGASIRLLTAFLNDLREEAYEL